MRSLDIGGRLSDRRHSAAVVDQEVPRVEGGPVGGGGRAVLNPAIQGSSYLSGQRLSVGFVWKFALRGERGRKGRECKFQNKAHTTVD